MLESDSDRLALLKGLGGSLVSTPAGALWGIFDAAYVAVGTDAAVEATTPALVCRSSDVALLGITKDVRLSIEGTPFRVARAEPDGTGMTTLVLRR